MMRSRTCLPGAVCAAIVLSVAAHAATLVHTTRNDFATGAATGAVVAFQESAGATSGSVGVLPGVGPSTLNEDFNYADKAAAEAAGWLFLMPNVAESQELVDNPSTFSFPAEQPGNLRLHVSRPHDLWNTGVAGQRMPMLALKDMAFTGDFIVETKIVQEPRLPGENRHCGIYIGQYIPFDGVSLTGSSAYLLVGPTQDAQMTSVARYHPEFDPGPHGIDNLSLTGETVFIRVVKRGQYFYSYMKGAEDAPWIYQARQQVPPLAGTDLTPLVLGVFGKSWGGTGGNATRYRDVNVDYFRVNQINGLTGTFTNVFDAGDPVNWQAISFVGPAQSSVKYQLRTGNALTGGSVSDGDPFVGPDGTAATWFEDDTAALVPNGVGKRYLEYKLSFDATDSPNLPPIVREIAATYQPGNLRATLASSGADFGAETASLNVQPGAGDLSLARTEVFRDDFNGSLAAGWQQSLGNPTDPGEITLSERSGYLRMKVGADQNLWLGAEKTGGVRILRDLPGGLTDYEIETEVDMQTQVSRIAQVVLWQDEDNWVTLGAMQRFWDTPIGPAAEAVLADLDRGVLVSDYWTNTIQLRIARRGQTLTLSYRDAASPSWHVARVMNTTGLATGGADFAPTKVGLMVRSYGLTDRAKVNHDFNYFTVSSLTATGARDIALTLPGGQKMDTLAVYGDGLNGANARFQVRKPDGTFVGPDGTAATFFTANEPKIPADLNPGTAQALRVQMDATTGVPYLHAVGLQYVTGDTCVARDTNLADFTAGLVKSGVDTSATPGVLVSAIGLGTTVTDEFTYSSNQAAVENGPWSWSNPSGLSSYSLTDQPGSFRMNVARPEDLWTFYPKNYVFLYRDEAVSGDWEIETVIRHPNGRQDLRHDGLGVVVANPDGSLNLDSFLLFGPLLLDAVEFASVSNNVAATGLHTGYNGTVHYLRMRKTGDSFTTWVRTDPSAEWTLIDTRTNTNLRTAYVGMLAKAWGAGGNPLATDWDYFKFTPIFSTGTFESRVLELTGGCPVPFFSAQGTGLDAIQMQFRAAMTQQELAGQPYVGSDLTSATSFPASYQGPLAGPLSGKRYYQYKAVLPPNTSLNDVSLIGLASATLPLTRDDVISALRLAGGLAPASTADVNRFDVVKGASANRVDLEDVAVLLRTLGGL